MKRIEIKARGFTFEAWSVGPEKRKLRILLLPAHLAEQAR